MGNLADVLKAVVELLTNPIDIDLLAKQYVAAIRSMVEINAMNLNINYFEFSDVIYTRLIGLSRNVVLPIGYVILAYLMVVELYNLFSKTEGLTGAGAIQMPLRIVTKIVIFKFIIDRSHDVLNAIFKLVLHIQNQTFAFAYVHNIPDAVIEDFKTKAGSMRFFEKIALFLEVNCISLLSFISMAIVLIVSVSRIFEIYIYLFIAPIPLATLPGSEISQMGKSFLKNFTAICLQGVILALILFLYTQVAGVLIVGGTLKEQFLKGLSAIAILTVCLFKSANWAKSICGAM